MSRSITLISINSRYSHSSPSLYYLKSALDSVGVTAEIKEFGTKVDPSNVVEFIDGLKSEYIGFSVYIWNRSYMEKLLSELEKRSLKIILGGPEVSYSPQLWLDNFSNVKHIVSSYGEQGIIDILSNGLDDEIVTSEYDFSTSPFIYENLDIGSVFKNKLLYYESSRGCLFRCSYCLSSRSSDKFSSKPIDQIKYELKKILDSSYNGTVKFIDRTFNYPKNRAAEIWSFLNENYREGITFHFEIHPSLITDEDFEVLDSIYPDYFRFEVGIQSLNSKVLKEIDRACYRERDIETIQRLSDVENIHTHLDMIVGLPSENYQSCIDTFNRIYGFRPDHFQVGFLKVLDGTNLSLQRDNYGIMFNDQPPYEVYKTDTLSESEIRNFKIVEDLVERIYNSNRFVETEKILFGLDKDIFKTYLLMEKYFNFGYGVEWSDTAKSILKFIEDKHPNLLDSIEYTLTMDWYVKGMFRYKPDFLKTASRKINKDERSIYSLKDGVVIGDLLIGKNSDGDLAVLDKL